MSFEKGAFIKQAVRASGSGNEAASTEMRQPPDGFRFQRNFLEASDWPLYKSRVIFRGGEVTSLTSVFTSARVARTIWGGDSVDSLTMLCSLIV